MNGNIEQRVAELERWKAEKEAQQIKFPLDTQSQEILNRYFMRIQNLFSYEVVGAAPHPVEMYVGNQGSQAFQLLPQSMWQYSVNTTSNQLTVSSNNSLYEAQEIYLYITPSGTYPAPFAVNTVYFVKNLSKTSSGSVFELSLTSGGAAINITTDGVGPQYIQEVF